MATADCPQGQPMFLTKAEVAHELSCCPHTVARLTAAGVLPQPRRFSRRMLRWPADAIRALAGSP